MNDDDTSQDDLVGRLYEAFDHDLATIPPRLSAAARDAFAWRRADAELAELLFDSASDELVGIRGTSTERRSFRFGAGDVVLRVHLTADTMVVMLEPPLSVECRLDTGGGGVEPLRTDELGELATDAPELPMRLELDLPDGKFVTPWITG